MAYTVPTTLLNTLLVDELQAQSVGLSNFHLLTLSIYLPSILVGSLSQNSDTFAYIECR